MRSALIPSALALLLAIGLAGCGSDSSAPTGGAGGTSGTFALKTIDGVPVPAVPINHWDRLDSDIYVISGGNFENRTVMSELDANGNVVRTYNLFDRGTVTVNGSTLTFYYTGSQWTDTGTRSGNTLTFTHDHGMETSTWVYEKQ
jgi:hypothetical protein